MNDSAAMKAVGVETVGMTMRFGSFTALDDVSIKVRAGSFHALLGENGAGKSTLVKCMMGFYNPTAGQMIVNTREVTVASPKDASALGLGMVYQHFTLVPSLTAAENLVISRQDVPRIIDWRKERAGLSAFMQTMPFKLPLDVPVQYMAAGEKQKLEIVKQLYLGRHFLVLDEPTSVLTPGEANDVLGLVRELTRKGDLTVLMISHKFHEVTAFADDVSVLRKGKLTGSGKVKTLTHNAMAAMMIGDQPIAALDQRAAQKSEAETVLAVKALNAPDRSGLKSITIADLNVRSGEIVGIAGISGNGQKEFLEVLAGQRQRDSGEVLVKGASYGASRTEARDLNVRFIPEEPLRNACAPRMTVAENLSFRTFDISESGKPVNWISAAAIKTYAGHLVEQFKVKTASLSSPISSLSGGNVQRAVLARELTGEVDLLIVSNPCFGLDFSAVAEIRARIMKARNQGTAVLLLSEDLDELLELSDRILVMSDGALVYETPIAKADVQVIGAHMAGAPLMAIIDAQPFPFEFQCNALALIVIDMQRDFAEPGGFGESLGNDVSRIAAIVPKVAKLIAGFRASGLPVIHTMECHRTDLSDCPPAKRNRGNPRLRIGDQGPMGRVLIAGEPGTAILDAVAPIAGELVIEKPGKGAFYATNLSEDLKRLGTKQIIFAGVTTEVCVQTTMREANDRGFDCLLAEDATESYFAEFKTAAIAMIRAQGAIVGWTAPVSKILEGLAHG